MPKEQDMNRVTTKTGTLLIRVVNDADGTPDSALMTSANLAAEIASAAGDVTSVNGLTGAVVLTAADIAFTPAGTVAATNVQAAIVEAASEGGTGGGIPYPAVEGTDGQVLAITAVGPIEVGWVDASAPVADAVEAHNTETLVHGRDMTNVLDTLDIGVNVQAYDAGTELRRHYDSVTGWPARNGIPTGMATWVNRFNATAPPEVTAGDLIFLS